MRAGSRCLSLLTHALNVRILRAHDARPLSGGELARALGWAPESSLRAAQRTLLAAGAVARSSESSRGATELTAAGYELLGVADALEQWLAGAPAGPVPLEDPVAHGVVRTLVAGWDSAILRVLAEQPQTLLELDRAIGELNYPALKRRLAKLRSTGLAVAVPGQDGTAYAASEWLRRAVAPLILAGRWERRHDPGAQPISRQEVEAALLFSLMLAEFPDKLSARCALAVLTSSSAEVREVAGVALEIERGSLLAAGPASSSAANSEMSWALGTVDAWLEALIDGTPDALRFRDAGSRPVKRVVDALHTGAFGSREQQEEPKPKKDPP